MPTQPPAGLLPARTKTNGTYAPGTAVGFFGTPPLRWIGSKWILAERIINQFPPHRVYVEPFCGSAAIFFRKQRSPVEVLNDLDENLVNFFRVMREQPDELMYQIKWTPYSEVEYTLAFEPADDPVERARRFYVALWQSFGGLQKYPSGWRRQLRADMRTPAVDTWRRMDGLELARERLMDAQISCVPALECIQRWDTPETVFYVDPPYVLSSRADSRERYQHEMDDTQHRALAAALNNIQGMAVLSGYPSPLYDELYRDWHRLDYSSTTNSNSVSTEVLWLSPNVTRPETLPLFAHSATS